MKPILFNTDMVRAIMDGRKTVTRRAVKFKGGGNPNWTGYVPDGGVLYGSNNIPAAKAQFKPGDIIYVRETWCDPCENGYHPILYKADFPIHYDAEETEFGEPIDLIANDYTWKPSIHMPKDYARIFLRVTRVSVERLQDISNEDAIKEGITRLYDHLTDEEYDNWSKTVAPGKSKKDWGWDNYLWHGHFGSYGTGGALSDAWDYQYSGYDEPRGSFSSLWNKTVPLKEWDVYGWDANPWVWVIEFERISGEEAEQAMKERG